MPTTYLDLTNKLLRRLNEVPISQSDFASVRGVQAMAKDAIIASVEEINSRELEWPFNASLGTKELIVGVTDYTFPVDLRTVKWDSYHITKDEVYNTGSTRLQFVSRNVWEDHYKDADLDAVPDGLGLPKMVFESFGFGFGVSPLPDKTYSVNFEYFKLSPSLDTYDSSTTIPTVYDETIIQGAIYHFYMFRDNSEQAQIAEKKFNNLVETMRTVLMNKEDRMRSTLITVQGGRGRYAIPSDGWYV